MCLFCFTIQFNEEINTFPDESNDDRILQCCLLFKKKGQCIVVVFLHSEKIETKAFFRAAQEQTIQPNNTKYNIFYRKLH